MSPYRVILSDRADDQLASIFLYIAANASAEVAQRQTDAIVAKCNSLSSFPNRGSRRDDLRPGVRTLTFRGRVTIAYELEGYQATILGIFYAGQDFEARLREN